MMSGSQIEAGELLPHVVVSAKEMAAWPIDRKRSERTTWSEVAWGGDSEERPKLFNWNIWPNRVVFRIDVPDGTPVVRGEAVWRRSSLSIRVKGLKLLHAESGTPISDARLVHYDQEHVIVDFRPVSGSGIYHLYYGAAEEALFAPSPQWLDTYSATQAPPAATPECIEARCPLDSFFPMEVVALETEVQTLLAAHPEATYLVFPEDRDRPIVLRAELPAHWAREGPAHELVLQADRNEYRVFQLGLWACYTDLNDVQVSATDLQSFDNVIPASRVQCLTLHSKAQHLYMGRPTGPFDVPQGQVRALWFGIDLPEECASGKYVGSIVVQPIGQPPTSVRIQLNVSDPVVPERGDHDLWRLSRLRWLESDVGLGGEIYAPFTPLALSERDRSVSTWGHTFALGSAGLIDQVRFGAENTLAAPVALQGRCEGESIAWQENSVDICECTPGHITWRGRARAGPLRLTVEGRIEFDGCAILALDLSADEAYRVEDLALRVPWRPEHAELATGMGYRGRRVGDRTWRQRDSHFHYSPCVWLGSIQAGLGWLTESGEPWEDPAKTDAVTIRDEGNAVTLRANLAHVGI